MDAKRKKELKSMLVEMRDAKINEIKQNTKDMESVDSFKHDAQDFADTATNIYEKELHYDLTEKNKKLLTDIEDAIQKIEQGAYGKCEKCGKEISIERMKALPFAKYCIKCQSGQK